MRSAVRGAALVTLGYLLATLPFFLRGAMSSGRTVIGLVHVASLGATWWSLRSSGERRVIADWLPLLLVPILYAELPYLNAAWGTFYDPRVRGWEAALFGTQPARTLAPAMPSVALSELLHLGYLLYYPIVYVPPLLLYVRDRQEEFGRTVLAIMLTYCVCFLTFVLFPVEGPRYAWGPAAGAPAGPLRSLALALLERGSSRGTAFPSSHAAVAVAQGVMAVRYQPRVGAAVLVTSLLLMVGAVYGGFHYAVDVMAGGALGFVVAMAVAVGSGASNSRRDGHLRRSDPLPNLTRP